MKSLFIALAHMHHHRVIHRDVKPSNFLYSNDEKDGPRAVLVDFGLAQKCAHKPMPIQSGATLVKHAAPPISNRHAEKERKKLLAVDSLVNSFSQSSNLMRQKYH
jgi:serine/threonine protein kinase